MLTTPDFQTIRANYLRDIANQLPDAAMGNNSDFAIRANALAAALEGVYQHQQWIIRQMLPDTADADFLERWASLWGIKRKSATAATVTLLFSAAVNSSIPIGTEAKAADGTAFITTAAGSILANGTLSLPALASVAGIGGNLPANTPLILSAAPAGVNSNCTLTTLSSNGFDAETDADLSARLLSRLRNPPHGGNANDYLAWALAVPGVAQAFVYPLRRGLGTVDVVIEAVNNSLPSAALIANTQAAINTAKPVTANCLVLAPTLVPVTISASLFLSGTTLATVVPIISAALNTYFATLKPGDSVIKTRILAIISDTPGVVDFNLTSPAANVDTLVNAVTVQLASIGSLNLQ